VSAKKQPAVEGHQQRRSVRRRSSCKVTPVEQPRGASPPARATHPQQTYQSLLPPHARARCSPCTHHTTMTCRAAAAALCRCGCRAGGAGHCLPPRGAPRHGDAWPPWAVACNAARVLSTQQHCTHTHNTQHPEAQPARPARAHHPRRRSGPGRWRVGRCCRPAAPLCANRQGGCCARVLWWLPRGQPGCRSNN
jgi:hypothetical protein